MKNKSIKELSPVGDRIRDFKDLMKKIRQHGGENTEILNKDSKKCASCGSCICQMVQEANDLKCHTEYK